MARKKTSKDDAGGGERNLPEKKYSPEYEANKFKPGQSGNPAGRKKGEKTLRTILKEIMQVETLVEIDGKMMKKPFNEAIMFTLLQKAKAGNLQAIQFIFEKIEPTKGGPGVQVNINNGEKPEVFEIGGRKISFGQVEEAEEVEEEDENE